MGIARKLAAQLLRKIPVSRAQGLGGYWRDLERLKDADIAFVSFPKSGRTFVRSMVARLFDREFAIDERELLRFSSLCRAGPGVPRMLITHDGDAMRPPSRIRVNRRAYRGRKVILLTRHPGDVVVSRYFHLKYRSFDRARQRLARQPLEDFVWTRKGGVPSIVQFLNGWARLARERGDVLILRYEDFLAEPDVALKRLASFAGLDSSDSAIADAVEFGRLENLRAREREGYFRSRRFGSGRAGNEDSFKVRSGKSGGFRVQLSESNRERVEGFVRSNLDPVFGYSD